MAGGIVQHDLSLTELPNTPASPVNTFVQPGAGSSVAGQFLEGIGKLAPQITTAVQNYDKEAGDEAEAQARIKALTADPKDLRAEIDNGNYYGLAHHRGQTALRVMDAQNRVFDVSSQLDAMHQRGELAGADAQGRIGELVNGASQGLMADPLAAKTFASGMVPVMRKYSSEVLRTNVQNAEANKGAQLFSYLTSQAGQVDRDAADGPQSLAGNNPGNIEDGVFAKGRGGYAGVREGGRFAAFNTAADGYRAANDLLNSYAKKGVVTPALIIARWAPASDNNDPTGYARAVAKSAGLDPDAPLPSDPASRAKMLVAMTKVEHGKSPYNADQVAGWLSGGNDAPATDTEAKHKAAVFRTADFAKNDLLMSPAAIEASLGNAAKHYAETGNVPALAAIGEYDRGGSKLKDKYGPQWDVWTKTAEANADSTKKKAVNSTVDGLTARALTGNEKPEDFYKAVDDARLKDPVNFGEARAVQLKQQFDNRLAARNKAANDQLSEQQEAAGERSFVESGAAALSEGKGYALPDTSRFTAADGKERTYARKDYEQQMYDRATAAIDQQAKANGWTPEQTAAAKVKLYGQNGAVHPLYQASFNDLYIGSRAGVAPNPEQLPQRLGQLEFMRTTDPSQFLNMADKRDTKQQTWLAAYNAGRDYGMDPERAFAVANQLVFNPTATERLSSGEINTKVEEVMKNVAGNGVLAGPIARAQAAAAVNLQIAAGTADKDIVDKASAQHKQSYITVNGVPVHNNIPGVGDAGVAAEYLQDALRFEKGRNPRLKDVPLAFADAPEAPGKYIMIDTRTMERMVHRPVDGGRIKDYVLQWREQERQGVDRIKALSKEPMTPEEKAVFNERPTD